MKTFEDDEYFERAKERLKTFMMSMGMDVGYGKVIGIDKDMG